MSGFPEPPLADPSQLDPEFRTLARPLYELVNQDPRRETFPRPLTESQLEVYRRLLARAMRRVVKRLELVSCKRTSGLSPMTPAYVEYVHDTDHGEPVDTGIHALVVELDDNTEDVTQETADTEYSLVPPDLLDRALWFYRVLPLYQRQLPPLDPDYGRALCQVLAMAMAHRHDLIDEIFPFLVHNPPLGFTPSENMDSTVYRVLVP